MANTFNVLDIFKVGSLPSVPQEDFVAERGGKATRANTKEGFLCYGQYKQGYPTKRLQAVFHIMIDNNTADDRTIMIVDVYDHHSDRLFAKEVFSRKDFPKANQFCLFTFDFTPPSPNANMEFRIFYMGAGAYVCADYIVIIDPAQGVIKTEADFQAALGTTISHEQYQEPEKSPEKKDEDPDKKTPEKYPPAIECKGNEILCIPSFNASIIAQKGGTDFGGEFSNGMYKPRNQGGIQFNLTIDTARKYSIEFEINGGLANWQLGGENGGRIVLFGTTSPDGYWLMIQRMEGDETFGPGKFRGYFAYSDWNYASNVIPNYSMQDWKTEPHRFKMIVEKNTFYYYIDDFQTAMGGGSPVLMPQGTKQITFMLGNDIDRLPNFNAVTYFKWLKIAYE